MTKKRNNATGTLIVVIIGLTVFATLGYAYLSKSTPQDNGGQASVSNTAQSANAGVSCSISPNSSSSSAGGCPMMGGNRTTPSTTPVQADPQAQVISMNYNDSGLTPATVNVEAGKSYTISMKINTNIYGCMSSITIPGLSDSIQSLVKGNTLTFNIKPTTAGTYEFKCAMGLSHQAQIIVK